MTRLILTLMLLPVTGMTLFGPGLVLRCHFDASMGGMMASMQSSAIAALLFAAPIAWGASALIMGAQPGDGKAGAPSTEGYRPRATR